MKPNNFSIENEGVQEDERYAAARQKVRRQIGFYIHVTVYVLVNIFLILLNVLGDKMKWTDPEVYYVPLFWGIGLLIHGFNVFMPDLIFGKNWEARQIKKYLDKRP